MTIFKNFFLIFLLFGSLSGCSSKSMMAVPEGSTSYAPESHEAMIVFFRPSSFGGGIQASVFDVTTDETVFIGIISHKTKLALTLDPGNHKFMVIGENADFLQANLTAGKTYYCRVDPRMGAWKARFSLGAIHKNSIDRAELDEKLNACGYVMNTDASHQWAKSNAPSIEEKRDVYYKKWIQKEDSNKPTLNPEDGY